MTAANSPWLIFTDLDGTLLDKHSYAFGAAEPALRLLAEKRLPLIFNTSKTIPEVLTLRQTLNNQHPFICENGGVVVIPDGYFPQPVKAACRLVDFTGYQQILLGTRYTDLLDTLQQAADSGFRFRGFHQYPTEELARLCEFSEQDARLAKQRSCSEPIVWQDSEQQLSRFEAWLSERNLTLVKGGRFYHLMAKQSKGHAMARLTSLYEDCSQRRYATLALGDSDNDLSMLRQADMAVVIATEQGSMPLDNHPNSHFPPQIGPAGWNQAILNWIDMTEEH